MESVNQTDRTKKKKSRKKNPGGTRASDQRWNQTSTPIFLRLMIHLQRTSFLRIDRHPTRSRSDMPVFCALVSGLGAFSFFFFGLATAAGPVGGGGRLRVSLSGWFGIASANGVDSALGVGGWETVHGDEPSGNWIHQERRGENQERLNRTAKQNI